MSASAPATPRDPDALPRLALTLLIIALLWPGFRLTEFDPGALFDPRSREVMGRFIGTFFPLETDREFLALIGRVREFGVELHAQGLSDRDGGRERRHVH